MGENQPFSGSDLPSEKVSTGESQAAAEAEQLTGKVNRKKLKDKIVEHFNLEEVRTICFNLGIEPDEIPGETRTKFVREFILYLERRNRIDDLFRECKTLRPTIDWDRILETDPDFNDIYLEPAKKWYERGRFPTLLGAGAFLFILISIGFIATREGEPTATPDPTPEPELLTVLLDAAGCANEHDRLVDTIQQGGGVVADEAQMEVQVSCSGTTMEVAITMPEFPHKMIPYLDELETLFVSAEFAYGRTFIEAAIAYANGQYLEAAEMLERDVERLNAADAYYLLAQAQMHNEEFVKAREAYTAIIENWPETPDRILARAHAGSGLSYIFHLEQEGEAGDESITLCFMNAENEFNVAIEKNPERALWWLGRYLVYASCTEQADPFSLMLADLEQAAQLIDETDHPFDRGMVLSVQATELYYDDDISGAIDTAERAISIAPKLSLPYGLLSCIYQETDNMEAADEAARKYVDLVVFSWQQQEELSFNWCN